MNPDPRPFAGRRLCIATMHGKERVLQPVLEGALGVVCVVPGSGFDTDRFGTFSGTVPRTTSVEQAARAKAEAGMFVTGTDLAVASEGSFGPHPDAPMLASGMELVLFVDRRSKLVLGGHDVSLATNHAQRACHSVDDVVAFAGGIGFPAHGVMLAVGDPPRATWSGASTVLELRRQAEAASAAAASERMPFVAAADMRAHRNPTRMQSIARAAETLVEHLRSACPSCGSPGFGAERTMIPLPCGVCGELTRVPGDNVLACLRCSHRERRPRNDGITTADAGACDACNP